MYMNKLTKTLFIALLGTATLIGAGCGSNPLVKDEIPRTTPVKYEELTPAERSRHVNFLPGSIVQMEQEFFGFGTDVDLSVPSGAAARRVIVIDRFAPDHVANLSWSLVAEDGSEDGESTTKSISANITGFDLDLAHQLRLPSFWPPVENAPSLGSAGIWFSRERFEGLQKSGVSTIDPGLTDVGLQGPYRDIPELRAMLDRLNKEAIRVGERTDVYRVTADETPGTVTMTVNKEEMEVEVLRATNWFGEYIILNNSQNPIVISFRLQDRNEDGSLRFEGADVLKRFVDYDITALNDVYP